MKARFLIFFLLLFSPCLTEAQILLPSVSSPIKKIPVAVSVFKADGVLSLYGKDFGDTFKNDLNNAAFFNVLPVNILFSSSVDGIDFEYLKEKKTKYLVSGSLDYALQGILYELIVYDVDERREFIRKRYVTSARNSSGVAHKFAGELMRKLTGLQGFFESKIVFVAGDSRKKDIFIMDYDGENVKKLTNHRSMILSPDCSSGGDRVVFTSDRNWDHDLYVLDFKNSPLPAEGSKITGGIHLDSSPSWSPDGTRIAFSREGDIYVASDSGEIQKRLTKSAAIDVSPTWSPDGKKIAFVSDKDGSPNIYVINSNGGNPKRITQDGYNTDPSWSPSAEVDLIAFVKSKRRKTDIYTIGSDGNRQVRLTFSGSDEHPSWSPDGRYITFSSKKGGKRNIYLMYLNGENKRALSRGKNDSFSSWCAK